MATLIDTNVIVRLIIKNPQNQFEKAKEFFEKVAKREVEAIIDEGVVLESFYVLNKVYKIKREKIVENLLKIFALNNIKSSEKEVIIQALKILQNKNIDFIDALLCAKAKIRGYKIFSFDKDINRC